MNKIVPDSDKCRLQDDMVAWDWEGGAILEGEVLEELRVNVRQSHWRMHDFTMSSYFMNMNIWNILFLNAKPFSLHYINDENAIFI